MKLHLFREFDNEVGIVEIDEKVRNKMFECNINNNYDILYKL